MIVPPSPATCPSISKWSKPPGTSEHSSGWPRTYSSIASTMASSSSTTMLDAEATVASKADTLASSAAFCARASRPFFAASASSFRFFSSLAARSSVCAVSASNARCSSARSAPSGSTRKPASMVSFFQPETSKISGPPFIDQTFATKFGLLWRILRNFCSSGLAKTLPNILCTVAASSAKSYFKFSCSFSIASSQVTTPRRLPLRSLTA
mmetsp:Transcript_32506/g.76560  ORF Transcript_32506/g.76560 Transcript_32506/m.76560 type:complete len:210 (-) Transcript_32506:132-761(-)